MAKSKVSDGLEVFVDMILKKGLSNVDFSKLTFSDKDILFGLVRESYIAIGDLVNAEEAVKKVEIVLTSTQYSTIGDICLNNASALSDKRDKDGKLSNEFYKALQTADNAYAKASNLDGKNRIAEVYVNADELVKATEIYISVNSKGGLETITRKCLDAEEKDLDLALRCAKKMKSKPLLAEIGGDYLAQSNYKEALDIYKFAKDNEGIRKVAEAVDDIHMKIEIYSFLDNTDALMQIGFDILKSEDGNRYSIARDAFMQAGRDDLAKFAYQFGEKEQKQSTSSPMSNLSQISGLNITPKILDKTPNYKPIFPFTKIDPEKDKFKF